MTDPTTHHHDHAGVATTESGHRDDSRAENEDHTMEHGDHAGHGHHGGGHAGHGDHVGQFRRLFWINLIIAIPVVAFSPMFATLLGYSVPSWAGWVAAVLGSVMYAWGGTPFLTGAVSELKSRQPGMMLLIALGITVAFLASWAATVGLVHPELEFWWELALLIVIMLLGHWIEMRSLAQTTSALDSLAALLPDEAERIEGDDVVKVDPAELRVGDVVIVRPGGSVPADGKIVEHWDGLVEQTPPNSSGRTQLDGPTDVDGTVDSEASRAFVERAWSRFLQGQDYAAAGEFTRADDRFAQHSGDIADGVQNMVDFLEQLKADGSALTYDTLHRSVADGNFVLTYSEGSIAGERHFFCELWRIEDGAWVELWDAIGPVAPDDELAHPHGAFASTADAS